MKTGMDTEYMETGMECGLSWMTIGDASLA